MNQSLSISNYPTCTHTTHSPPTPFLPYFLISTQQRWQYIPIQEETVFSHMKFLLIIIPVSFKKSENIETVYTALPFKF